MEKNVAPALSSQLLADITGEDRALAALAIADMLFQIRAYTDTATLALAGLPVKHELEPAIARKVWSVRSLLEELGGWLSTQENLLCELAKYKRSAPHSTFQAADLASDRALH